MRRILDERISTRLNNKERTIFEALPEEFTAGDIIGMTRRTADKYIAAYLVALIAYETPTGYKKTASDEELTKLWKKRNNLAQQDQS